MSTSTQDLDILSFQDVQRGKIASTQSPQNLDILSFEEVSKPESRAKYLGRSAARTAARATEAVAGLPGDILSFLVSAGVKGGRKLGLGDEHSEERASKIQQLLPTSKNIREQVTERITGESLKPHSSGEKIYDDFIGDLSTLAIPVKGKIPFSRALGMAVAGTLGKESAQVLGASDTASQFSKLGLMTIAGLVGRGNAKQYANNLYREAINTIPEDAKIGSKSFTQQVDTFLSNLQKGGMSPQKQPAFSLAKQLKDKIKQGGGEVSVSELPEFRKSINDYRFNRQSGLTDAGRYYLDRFDDVVDNQLREYGKQNAGFLPKYRDANTALAGFKQSNKIAKYISKHYDPSNLKPETILMLGLHLGNPSAAAKIGGLLGTAKLAALSKRLTTNPILRKHYEDVLKDALKENKGGLARNILLFDKAIEKEESK